MGWITDSQTIMNKLFEYYMFTDGSQTTVYSGLLISLPRTYWEFINDPTGMQDRMYQDLHTLLNRYFDTFEVETRAVKVTESEYRIAIYASGTGQDGKVAVASKAFRSGEEGSLKAINIANYGEGIQFINGV